MADKRAREAERRAIDTEDTAAVIRGLNARVRAGEPNVLLDCLKTLAIWESTPAVIQDMAIAEVGRRLNEANGASGLFKAEGIQAPHVGLDRVCIDCGGFGQKGDNYPCFKCGGRGINVTLGRYRLGYFKKAGMRPCLFLIPGKALGEHLWLHVEDMAVKPFLLMSDVVSHKDFQGWRTEDTSPVRDRPYQWVRRELSVRSLRLPTVSEWCHAAKAGASTRFYWGDELIEGPRFPVNQFGLRFPVGREYLQRKSDGDIIAGFNGGPAVMNVVAGYGSYQRNTYFRGARSIPGL